MMALSKVDRQIYLSLYNLTRPKSARKQFICKKCKKSIDIKQGLTHFDCHIEHDATGVIRYCGHCDQTFFMQNDTSRELMYRRHVYECISGRSCSGKLLTVMQNTVATDNLFNPFLVNVQCAANVNQKKSVVLTDAAVEGQSGSLSDAGNALPNRSFESEPSSSSFAPPANLDHRDVSRLSQRVQTQYVETSKIMNAEQYGKEKQSSEMIRRSLELTLGEFTHFKYRSNAEQYKEKSGRRGQPLLFDDQLVDCRQLFRRLVAIVRKKLQQQTTLAKFYCHITGEEVIIGVDLLRHMQEHSTGKAVRVCCQCGGRFLLLNDYEEHIYWYHVLRCVLNLQAETDKDVRQFIDICRQGYLIDPSCPETFDEAAFLRGDRVNALKGYQTFLANNPYQHAMVTGDSDAMYRVLQMFPMPDPANNPLLDMQIRDTLRFYDANFEAMLEYECQRDHISSTRRWYDAEEDFNCKSCSADKRAIEEGTFDRYLNRLGHHRLRVYQKAFLSNKCFLARFPPEWLIDIKRDDYRERLPVEMGFYFWLVLIAHKLPYKHFSLFNDHEKQSQPIFIHMFVYSQYAKKILRELLGNPSLYYVLPYTCLCRDSSIVCDESNEISRHDNVHRHVIVVFKNRFALAEFNKKTRIIELDCQRVGEQNRRRAAAAISKRKRIATETRANKIAGRKKNQIKNKYMIPILTHSHYYHTLRYVSRDKVALQAKKKCKKTEDNQDNDRSTRRGEQNVMDNLLNHNRLSRHFYFSIPMVYHAKPCFFLLYPDGLSDWLAESFVVRHLLYRLLRCIRQRSYVSQGQIGVEYRVGLADIAPYLNHYIEGHGFPLKVALQDKSYPGERSAEIECVNAGVLVASNRINFHELRYFDDLGDVEVRLPPRLLREVKWMEKLHRQLIRFNLAMYHHLHMASEKIFWLNLRSCCLSDQLKSVINELTGTREQLHKSRSENALLRKNLQYLQENVDSLSQCNNSKTADIIQLRQQIMCLNAALHRLCRT